MQSHYSTSAMVNHFANTNTQSVYTKLNALIESHQSQNLHFRSEGWSCGLEQQQLKVSFARCNKTLKGCLDKKLFDRVNKKQLVKDIMKYVIISYQITHYLLDKTKNRKEESPWYCSIKESRQMDRGRLFSLLEVCAALMKLNLDLSDQLILYKAIGSIYYCLIKLHATTEAFDDSVNLLNYRKQVFNNYMRALDLDPNCMWDKLKLRSEMRNPQEFLSPFLSDLTAEDLIVIVKEFPISKQIVLLNHCLNANGNDILGDFIKDRNFIDKCLLSYKINQRLAEINPRNKIIAGKFSLEKLEKDYERIEIELNENEKQQSVKLEDEKHNSIYKL